MRKKTKRIAATLLLGIMLFGGVLTVQAAEQGNCYDHTGVRTVEYRVSQSVHYYEGNKPCTITASTPVYKIVCSKCGYVIRANDGEGPTTVTHSVNHQ